MAKQAGCIHTPLDRGNREGGADACISKWMRPCPCSCAGASAHLQARRRMLYGTQGSMPTQPSSAEAGKQVKPAGTAAHSSLASAFVAGARRASGASLALFLAKEGAEPLEHADLLGSQLFIVIMSTRRLPCALRRTPLRARGLPPPPLAHCPAADTPLPPPHILRAWSYVPALHTHLLHGY